MRIVILGNVVLLGVVLAGCRSERTRDPQTTTTTGAEVPAVRRDIAPPAVNAPLDVPAPGAADSSAAVIDLDSPAPAAASVPMVGEGDTRETREPRDTTDTRGVGAGAGAGD